MKRALMLMAVLGVFLLVSASMASASSAFRVRANVPFSFHAGSELLPAGDYWFELKGALRFSATGSSVFIRSQDGSIACMIGSMPVAGWRNPSAASLLFNKYGQKYYLREVRQGSLDVSVFRSRAEKEVSIAFARESGSPEKVVQLATTR